MGKPIISGIFAISCGILLASCGAEDRQSPEQRKNNQKKQTSRYEAAPKKQFAPLPGHRTNDPNGKRGKKGKKGGFSTPSQGPY